jgi:hypothetical protein
VASGDYPLLSRAIRDGEKQEDLDGAQHGFQQGLDRILDGVSATLPRLGDSALAL